MTDPLDRADPPAGTELNVRAARYAIGHTVTTCWHCRAATRVLAIAVPPGHSARVPDDADAHDADAHDAWDVAATSALLFYVDHLPGHVARRLTELAPRYRRSHGGAAGSYWANHCQACDELLDDHELFCEPEGAFLPTSAAGAARIRWLPVADGMEASAAGYAYEPQYLDAIDAFRS